MEIVLVQGSFVPLYSQGVGVAYLAGLSHFGQERNNMTKGTVPNNFEELYFSLYQSINSTFIHNLSTYNVFCPT